eukprot:CAMPEP_0197708836 /NCGR_PEP_ID=MMETSP1338-20131121/128155_1 /TAXON_ID=43686 ORGANISM="Pelagodinium beii, Strain RCC1491" /NCGR_SAMPLE_ID=MMETSP1338 /ASSEMBLY_ACC=CAM_ASM_000754 /LENGTH=68 /DNA_ID=CAMNT_0043292767 /DNA_START=346 /DNA_END=552 /DNA_ORIENTATION=+
MKSACRSSSEMSSTGGSLHLARRSCTDGVLGASGGVLGASGGVLGASGIAMIGLTSKMLTDGAASLDV